MFISRYESMTDALAAMIEDSLERERFLQRRAGNAAEFLLEHPEAKGW